MDVYIGIDVACAKDKYLPIVICTKDNNRLVPLPLTKHPASPPKGFGNAGTLQPELNIAYAKAARQYIELICHGYHLNPIRIGIDAPLKPRANHLQRRLAEQALDKAGISCFTTPSEQDFLKITAKGRAHLKAGKPVPNLPHAMQLWMLAGFAIADELSKLTSCIEVYPQATARYLGIADKHKTTKGQAEQQLHSISQYSGWPTSADEWQQLSAICYGATHDKVDAYSAAWVASLPERQRVALGKPEHDDAIWVPALKAPQPTKEHQTFTESDAHTENAAYQRMCPACGEHNFKRWPFGWDAHAAHRCAGLTGHGTESRKAEFKKKFLSPP